MSAVRAVIYHLSCGVSQRASEDFPQMGFDQIACICSHFYACPRRSASTLAPSAAARLHPGTHAFIYPSTPRLRSFFFFSCHAHAAELIKKLAFEYRFMTLHHFVIRPLFHPPAKDGSHANSDFLWKKLFGFTMSDGSD